MKNEKIIKIIAIIFIIAIIALGLLFILRNKFNNVETDSSDIAKEDIQKNNIVNTTNENNQNNDIQNSVNTQTNIENNEQDKENLNSIYESERPSYIHSNVIENTKPLISSTNKNPVTSSNQDKKPSGNNQNTDEENKKPEGSEQKPDEENKKPEGSEQKPDEDNKKPEGSEPKPDEENKKPEGSEPKPDEEDKKPEGSEPKPDEEDKKPEGNDPDDNINQEEETKKAQNDTKRKQIQNNYGIKVLYGDEIGDYKPMYITPVKLTDVDEIAKYLETLDKVLSNYPNGFFRDFVNKGMPLTICLVQSVNGRFAGFTDFQFGDNIKLTMVTERNTVRGFETTLNHEIMHYIDKYLEYCVYAEKPNKHYDEYVKLNPSGYSYGSEVADYTYNPSTRPHGGYFISAYAQSSVMEDRAEVFKWMMLYMRPNGCFDSGEVLLEKAKLISAQIKQYFPSVTKDAHWDRYLK